MPEDMQERGGVFFPIYQHEAFWLSFKSDGHFTIKTFVGGVNAVSGLPWNQRDHNGGQDYVVVPPQKWLDGVFTKGGQVKQFVAMPGHSGFGVEEQITGEDRLGGLQLIITPAFPKNFGCWIDGLDPEFDRKLYGRRNRFTSFRLTNPDSRRLNMLSTPRRLGIRVGSVIYKCQHSYAGNMSDSQWKEDGFPLHSRPSFLFELFRTSRERKVDTKTVSAMNLLRIRCELRKNGKPINVHLTLKISPWSTGRQISHIVEHRAGGEHNGDFDFYFDLYLSETYIYHNSSQLRRDDLNAPLWRLGLRDDSIMIFDFVFLDPRVRGVTSSPHFDSCQNVSFEMGGGFGSSNWSPWSVSGAAGGNIRQIIHKDKNPADTWIESLETLLNVQMLNAVAFESVTGMVAPRTPMSPETYTKAGLPFFKENHNTGAVQLELPSSSFSNFTKLSTVQEVHKSKGAFLADSVTEGARVGCLLCQKNLCDAMQVFNPRVPYISLRLLSNCRLITVYALAITLSAPLASKTQ
jgi:hypothetical protein